MLTIYSNNCYIVKLINNNTMKTIYSILLIILLVTSSALYSQTKGNSNYYSAGHDSLSIDGSNGSPFTKASFKNECFFKVVKVKGLAMGKVLKPKITPGCTKEFETLYVAEDKRLAENDILDEGSFLETGPDGLVAVALFLAGDTKQQGSFFLTVGPSSQTRIFQLNEFCSALKAKREYREKNRVTVVKGVVTYESVPGSSIQTSTVGKNASVKHTKTLFTHEVTVEGNDTIDVIRVFEGSVEVTYQKNSIADDEAMVALLGKVSEDMLAGKITTEEYVAKMTEWQNYSKNKLALSEPTSVDEGNKCTVRRNSVIVEPLGSDNDRWWENK